MAQFNFGSVLGTTISFDPALDILNFDNGYTATSLSYSQDSADLLLWYGSSRVRLSQLTLAQLQPANLEDSAPRNPMVNRLAILLLAS